MRSPPTLAHPITMSQKGTFLLPWMCSSDFNDQTKSNCPSGNCCSRAFTTWKNTCQFRELYTNLMKTWLKLGCCETAQQSIFHCQVYDLTSYHNEPTKSMQHNHTLTWKVQQSDPQLQPPSTKVKDLVVKLMDMKLYKFDNLLVNYWYETESP